MHKKILSWITIAVFSFSSSRHDRVAQQVPPELITYPELIVHNANVLTLGRQGHRRAGRRYSRRKIPGSRHECRDHAPGRPENAEDRREGADGDAGHRQHAHPSESSGDEPCTSSSSRRTCRPCFERAADVTKPRDKADALAQIANAARSEKGAVGQDRRAAHRPGAARAPHRRSRRGRSRQAAPHHALRLVGHHQQQGPRRAEEALPGTDRPRDDGSG